MMEEPVVASDGYTYEKKAILEWLNNSKRSPMTNAPFPKTLFIVNMSLKSAIKEWRNTRRRADGANVSQNNQAGKGLSPDESA